MAIRTVIIATVFSVMVQPSAIAASCKPGDPALAATYELRGVMEVGSAIRLHRDGRFQYMMSYGAVDEVAEGCWKRKGKSVELTVSRMQNNHGGPKFKKLKMKLNGSGGLVRSFDATQNGTYVRLR